MLKKMGFAPSPSSATQPYVIPSATWRTLPTPLPSLGLNSACAVARKASSRKWNGGGSRRYVLQDQQTRVTPPSVVERIHQSIPGSRYVVVANSAHLSPMEQPEIFASELRSFVTEAPLIGK